MQYYHGKPFMPKFSIASDKTQSLATYNCKWEYR